MNQDRMSPARTIPKPQNPSDALADATRRMKRDDEIVTRPARRTLKQMNPGYERQPILLLAPNVAFDERCPNCDRWLCPGNCQQFAPAPSAATSVKAAAA
ncbi:hypothetical protein [Streptomyces sp. NPDC056524]|uniref:hypothetical protein n=1 Tax=Streptomyces sp. NPDC056524 TaxID=3345851 RepID=UPI0036D11967